MKRIAIVFLAIAAIHMTAFSAGSSTSKGEGMKEPNCQKLSEHNTKCELTQCQHEAIEKTSTYVREQLEGEGSGHDWWHSYRVWQSAKRLAQYEKSDSFVVELAALLHDIADWKFHDGDESVGPRVAREWLTSIAINEDVIKHVCQIIKDISFKGADVATPMKTKEGMVVQDADRLDAIGAVGIARCFAYGGHKKNVLYNPEVQAVMHKTAEAYKKSQSNSVNHFYEKLLLLKDRMNTQAARYVAQKRHSVMENFLEQFMKEWDGLDTLP